MQVGPYVQTTIQERCIAKMAMRAQLERGRRFNTSKSHEIVELMRFALRSGDKQLLDYIDLYREVCDTEQRDYLASLHIDFSVSDRARRALQSAAKSTRRYRGSLVADDSSISASPRSAQVTYRGASIN